MLEVNADDLDCRVQAGVTREQVNAELKGTGLFFPIDPGANATIGGMAATRASGTNAVRYGTMRENVLGLTVVTPDGRIIRTGGRARKSSAGYDLTRLYVGAEGTLGVITEIQLRLYGVPEAMAAAVCQFDDARRRGPDGHPRDAARHPGRAHRAAGRRADGRLHPLFEARRATPRSRRCSSSSTAATRAWPSSRSRCRRSPASIGGGAFEWATQPEDRSRLWKARHAAYYAAMAMRPGKQGFATDACVPISRLADCILETKADVVRERARRADRRPRRRRQLPPGACCSTRTIRPSARAAEDLARRVSLRAIAMGGTCTGEHGIGVHKLDALVAEHGEAVDLMRTIKRALDPRDIMNPGKTVPE